MLRSLNGPQTFVGRKPKNVRFPFASNSPVVRWECRRSSMISPWRLSFNHHVRLDIFVFRRTAGWLRIVASASAICPFVVVRSPFAKTKILIRFSHTHTRSPAHSAQRHQSIMQICRFKFGVRTLETSPPVLGPAAAHVRYCHLTE